MLEALVAMPGGSAALPFVRLFYGLPSRYLWEDEHSPHFQGEGGEQEDALMPLLFSLGQHAALEAVRRRLRVRERLFRVSGRHFRDYNFRTGGDRPQHLGTGASPACTNSHPCG